MTAEQWGEVLRLVEQASDVPAAGRGEFVGSLTQDAEVAARVLDLLTEASQPGISPARESRSGTRVAHYQVGEMIGSGGMGEVYGAVDVHLDRAVAIKFLPASVLADSSAVGRFLREARASSSLNHPNIVTIHEFIREDNVLAIVMERIDGGTLRALAGKPADLEQFLDLARQIAAALASAHAGNIVHRDIKPENLMLRKDGYLKVVDFGLAGLNEVVPDAPAQNSQYTTTGGTLRYMSPEQRSLLPTTAASDIYSFGAVCREFLTGVEPAIEATADLDRPATAPREASLASLRPDLPPPLTALVERMLDPVPGKRPASVEIVAALEQITAARLLSAKGRGRRFAIAAAAAAAAGIAGWIAFAPSAAGIWRSRPLTSEPGVHDHPAISPDGTKLVYSWAGAAAGSESIYTRDLRGGPPRRLTESPRADIRPAWSPDGMAIAYFRKNTFTDKEIRVVAADGTSDRMVARHSGADIHPRLAWSFDGRHLVTSEEPASGKPVRLVRIAISTGRKEALTTGSPGMHHDIEPALSPDGSRIAFLRTTGPSLRSIFVMAAAGGTPVQVGRESYNATSIDWMDSRSIVAAIETAGESSNLWSLPVAGGNPARLTGSLDSLSFPTVSPKGIAYVSRRPEIHIWRIQGSRETRLIASRSVEASPSFSPDGRRIAFRSSRTGAAEIWVCQADGSEERQITRGGMAGSPSWSPDGLRIAFDTTRSGKSQIYAVDPEGRQPEQPLARASGRGNDAMPFWSPDGHFLYFASDRDRSWRIWKRPSDGSGEPQPTTLPYGGRGLATRDGKFVVTFNSMPGEPSASLFRFRTGAPSEVEPERIVSGLSGDMWGNFAVSGENVYFVAPGSKAGTQELRVLASGAHRARVVATLGGKPLDGDLSLAVSPDGNTVLYTRREPESSTIALLERVR